MTTKRRITPKGVREKGLRYEREIVAHLKDKIGIEVARGVAGAQAFDQSKGSSDIFGAPRLAIEAKRTERFTLNEFMEQAVRNATGDNLPVVIHRQSRQSIGHSTVAMRFDDFLEIYDAFLRFHGFKADDRQ
jgi:hypothetical protein